MIIRAAKVDRYVFDGFVTNSRAAQEWMREVKLRTAWFTVELLADFYHCFYLAKPEEEPYAQAEPFHRWMVRELRRQHFYRKLHPLTAGQANASFRTALKALMWLTSTFEEEVKRRKQEEAQLRTIGLSERERQQGRQEQESSTVQEHLTAKQIERLKLVGYTLQQGKQKVEDKQAALDAKPLVAGEVQLLKERVRSLQEEMRTDFMRRDKLRQKLAKAEQELKDAEKQAERLRRKEQETFRQLDEQLGDWLGRALSESLEREENAETDLSELLKASQRIANRRWGSDLGRLHRQQYAQYLEWIEKLKRYPDLLSFLQEVGRRLQQLKASRKQARSIRMPESYDDLRQSGDIAHMLPSEASLLSDPDYENYFLVKWLEGKLLSYNISGRSKEPEKGPVICMLDTSHSMRGAKLRVAQIFVATFAAFSMLEKRDFLLMLFGARGELLERPLYWRKPDWAAFYALSQLAFGGGTHFDAPLRRGIELVGSEPRYRDADFVMVTDGVGAVSAPVRDALAELGKTKRVRLHTLIVGTARQHLVQRYDLPGVSHQVRFAASWESQQQHDLLLDVCRPQRT
ncbi:Uncharacterized protein, contains a von Willebrand factor type A (vWA) domain [Paenibacillus sp. UNCCL117]|uniref:hypothetical protein n=1 Tax=unclassified Paenibacillus TaxID=185978 RepID=UPI00088DB80C|nr:MULTISPECIES: hypothetical protein [unclassified Paenibacillus]SDC50708.1 Uncharacterized protein, contains a von Willebrand factor type A (vWA) domain [Paenibacillus sp. cl123]SFW11570.1 Uncharacterized protein, contains a von Willebrand factor type A (vWA) domain [Paenibacillus sp. UNCCL117]